MAAPYEIRGDGAIRQLVLRASSAHRFRFYSATTKKRIILEREGGRLTALVKGKIIVKKKPHANEFHFEFMRNNRLGLAGWGSLDHDTLVENLLEYVEVI
jgi:hypothetical protein